MSAQIHFETADDVLTPTTACFASGEVIKVTGSASNDRYYLVNTAGSERIEVKPKSINNAPAGPARRSGGHELKVDGTLRGRTSWGRRL